jgi:hypothetical protein
MDHSGKVYCEAVVSGLDYLKSTKKLLGDGEEEQKYGCGGA